ncbi:MAG: hypothetical protein M3Z05_13275 [Gemmatimonadota bacterium]|nr:hypothetical protein [Gemmatimonadota bacterium]
MTNPTTSPEELLLYWNHTGEGFTVNLQVTTDANVSASALMRITTNGASHDEPVGPAALKNWSHTLAANEKILGAITLVYHGTTPEGARIIGKCLKPDGWIHQAVYDSVYTRTGPDAQAIGVNVR